MSGVVNVDASALRAEVMAGTRIADLGETLSRAGVALANQGDVDTQSIAGAVATGTKGSGVRFGSMSSMVRGMRLVTGTGDILDIDETDADTGLSALQSNLAIDDVRTGSYDRW